MYPVALALILALSGSAFTQPPTIALPTEVKAAPAVIAEVRAETAGKQVKWVSLTPGLSVRPIENGRVLLFSGPVGRYELIAYTAAGDVPSDPARCVIVIETDGPPPPPKPIDELRKKLAAALASDRGARADVLQLAAVYREAARAAADPDVPTSRELLTRVRKVAEALIGAGTLPAVRGAVAEELLAVLGMTSDEPLTEGQRTRAADLFARLATTLEELTK